MTTQRKPQLMEYVYFTDAHGIHREGFVTDLLSAQFIVRVDLSGLPMFVLYSDLWQNHAERVGKR